MRRDGFTMVEMLVALMIFGIIIAGALGFYVTQNRAFALGSERAAAAQNLHYASSAVARDIAAAGTNLGPGQPFLVYAGSDVVAFNADYVSAVPDPFAVYHDPNAPAGTLIAPSENEAFTMPNAGFTYPDTTYPGIGGGTSGAEMIIFFMSPDTLTERTDDYALFRQVNGADAEMVARNLVQVESAPFFGYVRVRAPVANNPGIADVPAAQLPLRHAATIHGAAADTGQSAVIDSVRAVRLTFGSVSGMGQSESVETIRMLVWMPNANLNVPRTCGGAPIFGQALSANIDMSGGSPAVRLAWSAAVDEEQGEQDVIRYVIYRYASGQPESHEAYQSIPAGQDNYVFTDRAVAGGEEWTYAVAAQDCTPTLSQRTGASINIPGAP